MSEEDMQEVFEHIVALTDKGNYMSKYSACEYLHVSRPTFDRLVADGKIPKGEKRQGFNELFWQKSDLDKCKKSGKSEKK